ncbi:MAG: tetratricopeptide repeat protein [Proteobacteria bacterium]|nr:tetratricopeptide repeat protein [Pseudomonadota bacterium]
MAQAPAPPDIEIGLTHHRAGRLAEAERVYHAVLDADPREPRALRNLALLWLQRNEPARALPLAQAATEAAPEEPAGWRAYARALGMNGRFEAAISVLETRLAEGPERRDLETAVRRAWATALLHAGDEAAATGQLRRVAELTPGDPDAHANLGRVLQRAGETEAALEVFRRALAIDPEHVVALAYAGTALATLERSDEAEPLLRRAIEVSPADEAAVRQLGAFLLRESRLDEALAVAERTLALAPGGEAWLIRGGALFGLGRLDVAMEAFRRASEWAAQRGEALRGLGRVNKALGRHDSARAAFDQALALDPADAQTQLERAGLRLMLGDFEGGWADYGARLRQREFLGRSSGSLTAALLARLDPAPGRLADLAGRRLLLVSEQGIGDQVMFASLIPEAAAVAAEVTCVCERRLVGLLSRSMPKVRVLAPDTAEIRRSDLDLVLPMGALAGLLRRRAEDFPGTPYLDPGAEARARWARALDDLGAGPRVGISWRGGTVFTNTARRSLTLDQLAPVLRLPGVRFVSLQHGATEAEVAEASARLGVPIHLFPKAEMDDFQDLAALVQGLDAVVSVQNTVVHVSGAVGQHCLALLPNNPEWRYMAQGSAMPWYRSVELFRQPRPDDWASVVEDLAQALSRRLGLA